MKPVSQERLLKDVGRRIAEVRTARQMTQEELAELLGNGVRYVQAVEAGRQNVTLKTVAQFAAKLRIPVAAFFQAPSSKAPPPGRPRRS